MILIGNPLSIGDEHWVYNGLKKLRRRIPNYRVGILRPVPEICNPVNSNAKFLNIIVVFENPLRVEVGSLIPTLKYSSNANYSCSTSIEKNDIFLTEFCKRLTKPFSERKTQPSIKPNLNLYVVRLASFICVQEPVGHNYT